MVDVHKYIEEHKNEYFREIVERGEVLVLQAKIRNACDGDLYARHLNSTRESVTIQEMLNISERLQDR